MNKLSTPSLEHASQTKKAYSFIPKNIFYALAYEMSLYLQHYHERKQEFYKKTTDQFKQKKEEPQAFQEKHAHSSIKISKEILEAVTLKLHAFETQKHFLSQEVSLSSLSKTLGTNSSYLSKIINQCKGKSFKKYLNDMRISHAHQELCEQPGKRRYTIEAIAFDNGFKSAESFSKKFRETYGIYPSEFLRNLKGS